MKKIIGFLSVLFISVLFLSGCGKGNSASSKKSQHTVALVTDGGGIDDKSFQQSAWEGLQAWGKSHDLKKGVNGYNYAQSASDQDFGPNINKLVKANYGTIFGIGYKLTNTINQAAKQNPKVNFIIVDGIAKTRKNVTSVKFKTEQSSFLAGVSAAKTTKTKKVGFVGGIDSDVVTTFKTGFIAGVKAVDPSIKVDVKYAGSFSKADVGQSLTTAMINNGEDVIFHAAGGTGAGVFTAAKNSSKNGKKVWVIGVDSDQKDDGKYSGGNVTLASAVKGVDSSVEDISNKAMKGKFPGGKVITFDLKSKGVALINDNMPESTWKIVKEYQKKIENGEIKVSPK